MPASIKIISSARKYAPACSPVDAEAPNAGFVGTERTPQDPPLPPGLPPTPLGVPEWAVRREGQSRQGACESTTTDTRASAPGSCPIVAPGPRWGWRIATGVRFAAAVVPVALSWLIAPLAASAPGRDGFYLRGDFGDSDALTVRGRIEGVDQPTRCDRLLHPDAATVPRDPACSGLASAVFATMEFNRGAETMTSATALALGYSRGWLRLEAELNNTVLGGTSAPLLDMGRLAAERVHEWSAVEQPQARLSGFSVTDLFVNVHLDFDSSSRFTPFFGVGGGVSSVILAFCPAYPDVFLESEGLRVRRTLANGFAPVGGVDPATDTVIPAWQTRAAGTADSMSLLLAESTLGTNLIGGVAFEANDRFSIALRGRYARYGDVRKSGEWELVRSHAPVLADGRTPATFDLVLSDIVFYSVAISFVYDL